MQFNEFARQLVKAGGNMELLKKYCLKMKEERDSLEQQLTKINSEYVLPLAF